jgi:hypothetical protein
MGRVSGLERQELAARPDNPSRSADLVHVPRPRRPAFGEQVDDVSLHRLEDGHTKGDAGVGGELERLTLPLRLAPPGVASPICGSILRL